jgi:hypothetical protein
MGRAENIEAIAKAINKKAMVTGNPKVSKAWAVSAGKQLNVMQSTAIDYVKTIELTGEFGNDGQNFIVDLEKAKKSVGPEQTKL